MAFYNTLALADPRMTSTTQFRLAGKFISDSLTSAGFPKTADTGQVDWATINVPSVTIADPPVVYEIRRFDDSDQSTDPIFMKIGYGIRVTQLPFAVSVSLGTGSDGSGNLTHVNSPLSVATATLVAAASSTSNPTGAGTLYFSSCDTSSFGFCLLPETANAGVILAVERSTAFDGTPTRWGATIWAPASMTSLSFGGQALYTHADAAQTVGQATSVIFAGLYTNATAIVSSQPDVVTGLPVWHAHNGYRMCGASKMVVAVATAQSTPGQKFKMPHYEVTPEWVVSSNVNSAATGLTTIGFNYCLRIADS